MYIKGANYHNKNYRDVVCPGRFRTGQHTHLVEATIDADGNVRGSLVGVCNFGSGTRFRPVSVNLNTKITHHTVTCPKCQKYKGYFQEETQCN